MDLIKDIIRNKRRSDFRREKRENPDGPQRKCGRPRTSSLRRKVKPEIVVVEDDSSSHRSTKKGKVKSGKLPTEGPAISSKRKSTSSYHDSRGSTLEPPPRKKGKSKH